MIPSTTERVPRSTHEKLNELLILRIQESVSTHAQAHPQALDRRICELSREWDTDRVVETAWGIVILAGVGLAVAFSLWWLFLAGAGAVCLLSHALFGWDPLLPLYRRWGFRTSTEIDYERYALKALRGDFQKLVAITTPEDRDAISRLEGEGGPSYEGPQTPDAADPEVVQEALKAAKK
jgi:hypothetical protein